MFLRDLKAMRPRDTADMFAVLAVLLAAHTGVLVASMLGAI